MDCLQPGDVVILATPPAFRWVHFTYAIEKGLNVFMEKPVTVDGPTTPQDARPGREGRSQKNLKVGVGLMCRHCEARQELSTASRAARSATSSLLRAYRQTGPVGSAFVPPKPGDISELLYQIRKFHGFLWASGGCYSDFLIHNIDECCWMKDAWPVAGQGHGGTHYRGDCIDQNFDTYSVEYTFADGAKLLLEGRNIAGCHDEFASYAHGTKGLGGDLDLVPLAGQVPHLQGTEDRQEEPGLGLPPARAESLPARVGPSHRGDSQGQPYNEVKRGVEASLVTSMGRMAAHTGQVVTFDDMLNCHHEFAPDLDKLTMYSPAPCKPAPTASTPFPSPASSRTVNTPRAEAERIRLGKTRRTPHTRPAGVRAFFLGWQT